MSLPLRDISRSQVMARAVILAIYPLVDTVATSKDAEPGRLL
jgi:hypothetical protein